MKLESRRCPLWTVVLGILLPTVTTYVYFFALAEYSDSVQKFAMAAGKVIQFALPLICWQQLRAARHRQNEPHEGQHRSLGLGLAITTGTIIFAGMLGLYFNVLKDNPAIQSAADAVREKVTQLGFATPMAFVGLSVFYVVLHSLLEEYYWRWFIYGGLRDHTSISAAILISSLGFMAHHVLVLAKYFGWANPTTYLFSACVAIAGILWAWMYQRTGRLWAPWLSHAMADAAIFAVGFDMIRSVVG